MAPDWPAVKSVGHFLTETDMDGPSSLEWCYLWQLSGSGSYTKAAEWGGIIEYDVLAQAKNNTHGLLYVLPSSFSNFPLWQTEIEMLVK